MSVERAPRGDDQTDVAPSGFFVVRSPLLAYDDLEAWSGDLRATAARDDPAALEEALAADRATLRERLRAILDRPEVREALFVAAPDLEQGIARWAADPDSARGQRAERALVRFVERMSTRATPFGLFAGYAVGTIGDQTRLCLGPRGEYRRHSRLDLHYLCGLIDALATDPAMRELLIYPPSTGCYRLGDRLCWVQLTPHDPARPYVRHAVEATPELDALLADAHDGATGVSLRTGHGAALVAWSIERRLLESELEPNITGTEPIHGLVARLSQLAEHSPFAAQAATALREARDALASVDETGPGGHPERYRAMADRLGELAAPIELPRLFQIDLIKPAKACPDKGGGATLGREVVAELERAVEIVRRLARPVRDSLTRFRDAFLARYEQVEARSVVPLVEALDPELGIGFGGSSRDEPGGGRAVDLPPLLVGLGRAADTGVDDGAQAVVWSPAQALLLRKLTAALLAGSQQIELDQADLAALAAREPLALPDAISASGTLVAASDEAIAGGDFLLLFGGISGPSGVRMLGRFCHGDPELHGRVERHLRAEEALRPDAIFAEIAHLPEPRAGNVIHRPVLRAYEICYLGRSGAPIERQIPIDDLLVSVVDGRIVLTSVRLGREVTPRLTSAQNYHHPRATPIYRFLAALQDQGTARGAILDWGPLDDAVFLPRVRVGRLILARARWLVPPDEAVILGALRGSELFRAAHAWSERRAIPRQVLLADGDNELLVDFDNVLSVESFGQLLQARGQTGRGAVLVEQFPGPDQLPLRGPEGRYTHEIAVPFTGLTAELRQEAITPLRAAWPDAERVLLPGSDWLYARLYTGPGLVDALLRRVVRPLVERAVRDGACDGWFFLRYGDPERHLRLRLHGDPARLSAEVLPLIHAACRPALADRLIRRVELATYAREVERYGGPEGMALAEQLFRADSERVLAVIEAVDDEALPDVRWRLALRGMDTILAGLGLSLAERLPLARQLRDDFAREQGTDRTVQQQIGERYRQERRTLAPLLDATPDLVGPLAAGVAALDSGSVALRAALADVRAASDAGRLVRPLDDLAASYLHLHGNRLLDTRQRAQETVLYDLLARLYAGRLARDG